MVVTAVLVILLGLVTSLKGGSLANLARTRFRGLWILFAAASIQVGTRLTVAETTQTSLLVVIASVMLCGVFLALNIKIVGMIPAAVGLLLNFIVITANGSMPVSRWAADVAGIGGSAADGLKHEWLSAQSSFAWLADLIPIPQASLVVSIGDVVLWYGIGRYVYAVAMGGSGSRVASASSLATNAT